MDCAMAVMSSKEAAGTTAALANVGWRCEGCDAMQGGTCNHWDAWLGCLCKRCHQWLTISPLSP